MKPSLLILLGLGNVLGMGESTLRDGQAGLPTPQSTKSFWHSDPSHVLLGHRTTKDLPVTADVVVIGSGISGSFAARELVAGGKAVVMLEAREACWGATGRNGGHCQPSIYTTKPHLAQFELATYQFLEDLVAQHNISCDWRRVGGVHALPTQEAVDLAAQALESLRREHPDLADKATLFTDKQDLEKLRVSNASGAVLQSHAAKLWPYKLVAWVLETLLKENCAEKFNLQTLTPVTQLQKIVAKDVMLATNAYSSYLLPNVSDLIVPVRGQVAALRQPNGSVPLEHSHVWLPGPSDNYLIERDGIQGPIIVGGERQSVPDGGEGVWRDDSIDEVVAKLLRRSLHSALKLRPVGEAEEEELEASYEWTGIMGYSKDNHPWVGPVPQELGGGGERGGLWISAGFTGHGMPVAARCAIGVAQMILGKGDGVEIPKEFLISGERAEGPMGTPFAKRVSWMI
ncbi:putative oxidoreductase OrdL-like protein [Cladobotryum mycophilum]|uniref:Oxidoreductase OrdL-like protein n=1 Tax=Cladobotryum mycophilum TaxID=491253 RepID=A0ABR0SJJ1_9HYPO